MKSVMKHDFSRVPGPDIQRSTFNRSHGHKTTLDEAGVLYPIYVDEALPGDTFKLRMSGFSRLATPIVPIMDNMHMDTHFFSVPVRILWDNFLKFMGEQDNPDDSIDFILPSMPMAGNNTNGSIYDYFGLPTETASGYSVNTLAFRAYARIWNEWFRDQNLQDSIYSPTDDGPDDPLQYELKRRGKRHDYFTSSLPFEQKGPNVGLPLGDSAPVVSDGTDPLLDGGAFTGMQLLGTADTPSQIRVDQNVGDGNSFQFGSNTGLQTDLTNATAATINQLRQAFQVQRFYERDARSGSRYNELVYSHFRTVFDTPRYKPEYLGGGSTPINITPVPQTSASASDVFTSDTPQGNLAAYGISSFSGHGFTKSFTEHCIVIGLVSVRADLTYQQGLRKLWSRATRFDFYWPVFSHLGEQPVFNREIYAGAGPVDNEVFGYQERYAEYRYFPSLITGKFRSNDPQSLDFWHLSQDFANTPTLDDGFIQENPPVDRVIAVPDEPHFIFDSHFDLVCTRPMPVYSVPGLIDHF